MRRESDLEEHKYTLGATGAGVLVSMPLRRKATSMDAAIDNQSTRLVRAFAPRPAR